MYYFTGAADISCTIERSRLLKPYKGCILENVFVSRGQIIIGRPFSIGHKDTPIHVLRNQYVQKLRWINTKFVVLWDENDKRGWLVNGTSALLYLLRTSLGFNKTDKFNSAFLFKSEEMKEVPITHTTNSAT